MCFVSNANGGKARWEDIVMIYPDRCRLLASTPCDLVAC